MIRIIIEIDGNNISVSNLPVKEIVPQIMHTLEPVIKKQPAQPAKTHSPLKDERTCIECGKKFIPAGPRQERCSVECGLKVKPIREQLRDKIRREKPELKPEQVNNEIEKYLEEYEKKLQTT